MSDATDRQTAIDAVISDAQAYSTPAIATEGFKQSIAALVSGAVADDGEGALDIIVTAASMANSPKTVSVAVENSDSAYVVAGKIRTALAADDDVSGFFDIAGTGVRITLTTKDYDENDETMNLDIDPGTQTGIEDSPTSDIIVEGTLPDLSEVERLVDNSIRATRWTPGGTLVAGKRVLPATPNGRIYYVLRGGVSGSTEPFPLSSLGANLPGDQVADGTALLEDAGSSSDTIYDIKKATQDAWVLKASKAARFGATGGMNMTKVFDQCMAMAKSYEMPLVS